MGKARQTVERRQLGLALRRHRDQAKVTQAEAARHVGKTASLVSKIEDGLGTLDADALEALLDFYGVSEPQRCTLLELGTLARKRQPRGSVRTYTDTLPEAFQRLADMEQEATTIYQYQPGVIPGHLQTPRYIRALMRAGDGIWWQEYGPEPENRVAFRLERQARVLDAAKPKSLQFVFTYEALYDDGFHSDVMREQLHHLLELARKHRNIDLWILRVGALDNPAPGGGITVLDFESAPRVGFANVAYGPSTYIDDEEDTAALLRAFKRVQGLAMSKAESLKMIRDLARET